MNVRPEPGIYHDVDFEEYLSWDAVNNSSLHPAERSMAHFAAQEPVEPTEAMQFGSLVHCGRLEPDCLAQRYVVTPDFATQVRRPDGSPYANPRASGEYKRLVAEFEEENAGKEIVSQEKYMQMLGMLTSLANSVRANEYLGPGDAEVSIVWDDRDTGVRCKARLDKWSHPHRRIADLKTANDASDFERAIFNYRYHRQAAFYVDGAAALTGKGHSYCLVVVEKTPPYGVRCADVRGSRGSRPRPVQAAAGADCRVSP